MEHANKGTYGDPQHDHPSRGSGARPSSFLICHRISLALLLASSVPAAAEIYKYVDEKGVTQRRLRGRSQAASRPATNKILLD